jgi:hypothetical protein
MLSSTVTQNSKLYPQAKKGIAIDTFMPEYRQVNPSPENANI